MLLLYLLVFEGGGLNFLPWQSSFRDSKIQIPAWWGGGREGGIGESRNFADQERPYAGAYWLFLRILNYGLLISPPYHKFLLDKFLPSLFTYLFVLHTMLSCQRKNIQNSRCSSVKTEQYASF